jgi:Transposase DDE domain
MPNTFHDTTPPGILPADPLGSQDWEQEVLPRLPQGWQDQARRLKAFSRARQLRSAADVLRGILAYVLCVRSFRHLGCWSVLIGLADVSEAAWRKRMRQARAWLAWLVSEMLAVSACTTPWLVRKGLRRVLLVDGTHLTCLGKDGQTWRIHTSFDLLAGRLTEVQVTSDKVAEQWTLFNVQEGDLLISDRINGYQERLFFIHQRKAEAIVRFSPNTLPLFEEDGTRIDLVRWLKGRHAPAGRMVSRRVWLQADQQQLEVRVVALRLSEAPTQAARRRKCQKAKKDQRRIQPDTLYVAGWLLLITTLPAEQWSAAEVLALYRSRWHIELLFKRIKQLLDMHRLACVQAESVQASILALLLSWILQEEELVAARLLLQTATGLPIEAPSAIALPEPEQGQTGAISEWQLACVSVDVLRGQVRGRLSAARFRACLPRLHRFVRGSPRQRTHWFSQIRGWLSCPADSSSPGRRP